MPMQPYDDFFGSDPDDQEFDLGFDPGDPGEDPYKDLPNPEDEVAVPSRRPPIGLPHRASPYGDPSMQLAPYSQFPSYIKDLLEKRVKDGGGRFKVEEKINAFGQPVVTFGMRNRTYALGYYPHESGEGQPILFRGLHSPRGRVLTSAVRIQGEKTYPAGTNTRRERPRITGVESVQENLTSLLTPFYAEAPVYDKQNRMLKDKDDNPITSRTQVDPLDIFFSSTDEGDVKGYGKFTKKGVPLERIFGKGMGFVDLDVASEMNPTVMEALRGASSMPKMLVGTNMKKGTQFVHQTPHGFEETLLREASQQLGGNFYAKSRTMYPGHRYRVSEVPYEEQGVRKWVTTWKDARRPLRGTHRLARMTPGGLMPLPLEGLNSRFESQIPHSGTRQRILFADDQSLFAEGGAYMRRGRQQVVAHKSWRIGQPEQGEMNFLQKLHSAVQGGTLRPGQIFDESNANDLAGVSGYRLKRGISAQILGGTYESDKSNDYWLQMGLFKDAAEGTEMKTVAGMKYMTTPVDEHPLLDMEGADILAPLPAAKKEARVMTIFTRAFQSLPLAEQKEWMDKAAQQIGHKGPLYKGKGVFHDSAGNVMYSAAAMWAQTRRKETTITQQFSNDMLRLMQTQDPKLFKQKFGDLKIAAGNGVTTIPNYKLAYYDVEMPTSFRLTTTSGKSAASPLFLDQLNLLSPKNFGRLEEMLGQGKFRNPHTEFLKSYLGAKDNRYGEKIDRLDLFSDEAAPMLQEFRALTDKLAEEKYEGAQHPAMRAAMQQVFGKDKRALSLGGQLLPTGWAVGKLMKQMGSTQRQGVFDNLARFMYNLPENSMKGDEAYQKEVGGRLQEAIISSVEAERGGQGYGGLAKMAQTLTLPSLSGVAMGMPELPTDMVVSDPKATLNLLKSIAQNKDHYESLKKTYLKGEMSQSVIKAQWFDVGTTLPEVRIVPPRYAEQQLGYSGFKRSDPLELDSFGTKQRADITSFLEETGMDWDKMSRRKRADIYYKVTGRKAAAREGTLTVPKGGMLMSQLLFGAMNRDFDGDRLAALILGADTAKSVLAGREQDQTWIAKGVGQENIKFAIKAMQSGLVAPLLEKISQTGLFGEKKASDATGMYEAGIREAIATPGMGASFNPLTTGTTLAAELRGSMGGGPRGKAKKVKPMPRRMAMQLTNRPYANVYQQYMDKEPPTDPAINEWLDRYLSDIVSPGSMETGKLTRYHDVPFPADRQFATLDLYKQSLNAFTQISKFGQELDDDSYVGKGAHPGLAADIAKQLVPMGEIDNSEMIGRVTNALLANRSSTLAARKRNEAGPSDARQVAKIVSAITQAQFGEEELRNFEEIYKKRSLAGGHSIRKSNQGSDDFEDLPAHEWAEYIPGAFRSTLDPNLAKGDQKEFMRRVNLMISTSWSKEKVDRESLAKFKASRVRSSPIVDSILGLATGWTPEGADTSKAAFGPSMLIASSMANTMRDFPVVRKKEDEFGEKGPPKEWFNFKHIVGKIPIRVRHGFDNIRYEGLPELQHLKTDTALKPMAEMIYRARKWEGLRRGQLDPKKMREFYSDPGTQEVIRGFEPSAKSIAGRILESIMNPSGMGLFARGGYTGPGAPNEPAGIVHKGEHVVPRHMVHAIEQGNPDAIQRLIGQIQNPNKHTTPEGTSFGNGTPDSGPPMGYKTTWADAVYKGQSMRIRGSFTDKGTFYMEGEEIPGSIADLIEKSRTFAGAAHRGVENDYTRRIDEIVNGGIQRVTGSTGPTDRGYALSPTGEQVPLTGVSPGMYAWDKPGAGKIGQQDLALLRMTRALAQGFDFNDPDQANVVLDLMATEINDALSLEAGTGAPRTPDALRYRLESWGINIGQPPAAAGGTPPPPPPPPVATAAPPPKKPRKSDDALTDAQERMLEAVRAGQPLDKRAWKARDALIRKGFLEGEGWDVRIPGAPAPSVQQQVQAAVTASPGRRRLARERGGVGLRREDRETVLRRVGSTVEASTGTQSDPLLSFAEQTLGATVEELTGAAPVGPGPAPIGPAQARSRGGLGARKIQRVRSLGGIAAATAILPPTPQLIVPPVASSASAAVNATMSAQQAAAAMGINIAQVPANSTGRVTLGAVNRYAAANPPAPPTAQQMAQGMPAPPPPPPPPPAQPASGGFNFNVPPAWAVGGNQQSSGPASGTPAAANTSTNTPFVGMTAQQIAAATGLPMAQAQYIASTNGMVTVSTLNHPGVQSFMAANNINFTMPGGAAPPPAGAGGTGGTAGGPPGAAPTGPGGRRRKPKETYLGRTAQLFNIPGAELSYATGGMGPGGGGAGWTFSVHANDQQARDAISNYNRPGAKKRAESDEAFNYLRSFNTKAGSQALTADIDLVTNYLNMSEAERANLSDEDLNATRSALWRVNSVDTAQTMVTGDRRGRSVARMPALRATASARGEISARAKLTGLKELSPEGSEKFARDQQRAAMADLDKRKINPEDISKFTNALEAAVKPLQDLEKTTKGVRAGLDDFIDTSQKVSRTFNDLADVYDRALEFESKGIGTPESQKVLDAVRSRGLEYLFDASPGTGGRRTTREQIADLGSETQKAQLKKDLAPDTFSESMEKASVKLFSQLYTLNAVRRFVTAPMQRNADLYESDQVNRSVTLSQITSTPLSESGFAGTVLRRQTDTARLNRAMGQSYYNAWSPLMSGFASAAQGSGGAAGFMGAVGLPAIIGGATVAKGVSAFGSLLGPAIAGAATPIALGAAGLIAGVGTYNTFVSNRDNLTGMGRFAERMSGASNILERFSAVLSDIPSAVQYTAAGKAAEAKLAGEPQAPAPGDGLTNPLTRALQDAVIAPVLPSNTEAASKAYWFRDMLTLTGEGPGGRGRGYDGFDDFNTFVKTRWAEHFPGTAYPLNDIETAGLESDSFTERVKRAGISDTFGEKEEEIINDLFGALSRSGGASNYSNRQIQTIGEMVQLGLKPVDYANTLAQRRGRNLAFAPEQREDILKEIAARIRNREAGVTTEDVLAQMDTESQVDDEKRRRAMRYGPGAIARFESLVGTTDLSNIDALAASMNMAETTLMYDQLPQMRGAFASEFARRQAEVNSGINLEANTQFLQMAGELYSPLSQRMLLGGNVKARQQYESAFASSGMDQQMLMTAALSGDMRSLSALDNTVGGRFSMYNNQTGRRSMYGRLNAAQVANLRQINPTLAGLIRDPSVLEMGERDIATQQAVDQNRQFDISLQQNQIQRTLSEAMAGGVGMQMDARGFVSGGTMSPVKNIFEQFGLKFRVGNGMTPWEIEQNQLLLRREQQDFGIGQDRQRMGMAWGQYALAGQQFNDKFGLNQRQMEYNIGRQREEMAISDTQRPIRYQWQAEDFGYQRSQRDLGFGWQMEDFDRDIRYARGRQKRDLIRQRERAVVSYSMESGRQDTMEGRAEQEKQWTEEQIMREKNQFEQSIRFQQEEMQMQKRHFEEGRKFDLQSLQMQQEAFNKQVGWMQQERALEDQSFLLTRQNQLLQIEMNKQFGVELDGIATRAQDYANALQLINGFYEDVIALANSNQILQIIAGLVGGFTGGGSGTVTPPATGTPGQLPPAIGVGGASARMGAAFEEAALQYLGQIASKESALTINVDAREATSAKFASRMLL